jgi:hypothetical protein
VTAVLFYARLFHVRGETERAYLQPARSGACAQPAFSSDHTRLMEQMFADWQVTPEFAET